jgi:hypothetical protein
MLGPLPSLHRVIVAVCVLAVSLVLGAWLSLALPQVFLGGAGIGVGAALGTVVVIVLLHEPPQPHRRAVRVHRR